MKKEAIHDIVMVGGSSKIPKIRKLVNEYFGKQAADLKIKPDEAVANGATI